MKKRTLLLPLEKEKYIPENSSCHKGKDAGCRDDLPCHEWNRQDAVEETNQWENQIISPGFWWQITELGGCRSWSLVSSETSTVWGGLSCFPMERQLAVLTFHGSSSQSGLFQKWWALYVLYLVMEHAAVSKVQDCKQCSLNGARLKFGSTGVSHSIDHLRAAGWLQWLMELTLGLFL